MNNKNQRIGDTLHKLAESLKDAAFNVEMIRSILLEKESLPVTLPTFAEVIKGLRGNAGRGTWGQAFVDSNKSTNNPKSFDGACLKADQEGGTVTLISKNETKAVAPTIAPTVGIHISRVTFGVYCIHSNTKSRFYKILNGPDKGAVLRTNRKTGVIDRDGRYTGEYSGSFSHIGTVSCDQDGRDYVNRVIRSQLNQGKKWNERVKIVRMYRPKGHAGHFTHCDLYLR